MVCGVCCDGGWLWSQEFYRSKGLRLVTRPQSMADSCEEALDGLIDTCQAYRRQCEEYRNNAITG